MDRRALAWAALCAAVPLLLGSCRETDRTFDRHGITFTYPADWDAIDSADRAQVTVGQPLSRDVIGIDGTNLVIVSRYELAAPVTEGNFGSYRADLVEEWSSAVRQAGGTLLGEPSSLTVDGLPAIRFEATGPNLEGVEVASTVYLVFDGPLEYFLNCQRTLEAAPAIERGCDQIVRTFRTS